MTDTQKGEREIGTQEREGGGGGMSLHILGFNKRAWPFFVENLIMRIGKQLEFYVLLNEK